MIKYENETYLDTDEAARFLGKSQTSFRQFFYRNNFPRRKLGGRLYFPQKTLEGFFARRSGLAHFESSKLSFDQVYTLDQLIDIFLTSKQNIYQFVMRHKITRYKDNTDRTLYDKAQIDDMLNKLKEDVADI